MQKETACKVKKASKYVELQAPFDESTSMVESLKDRQEARTKRLLDDDVRRMGLDLPALARQSEQKQQEKFERLAAKEIEHESIRQGTDEMDLLAVENRRSAQLSKEKYAMDLHSQIDLKQEYKTRSASASNDGPLGPASLQVFAGEDLGGAERRRSEAKKHIEFINEQIVSRVKPARVVVTNTPNAISDRIEDGVRDQILHRGLIQRKFNETNILLSLEKRQREMSAKESVSTTLPETRVHTKRTDYKGLSLAETKSALIASNSAMIEHHREQILRVKAEGIEDAKRLEKEQILANELESEMSVEKRRELVHNLATSDLHAQINREEKEAKLDQDRLIEYEIF